MNPHLYSKNNEMQEADAIYALSNYFHIIQWKTDGGDKIVDVGCGDGRITADLLYPRLPGNVKKIVGVDLSSEMIKFAKAHHSKKKLSYMQLDIGIKQLHKDLVEEFDHIFSFNCFHWVNDKRQCVSNFYNLLRPGGDILFMCFAQDVIYDVYQNLSKHKIWAEHMKDFTKFNFCPFYDSEDPAKELRNLLSQIGFDVHFCKIIDRCYTFEDILSWKKWTMGYNPFLKQMSDDQKKNYMDDVLNEIRRLDSTLFIKNNNVETFQMRYKIFVVYANKPR